MIADSEICSINVHQTSAILFITYTNGKVETYKIIKGTSHLLRPNLKEIDTFDFMEEVESILTEEDK